MKKVAGGKTILFFYDSEGHLIEEIEKIAGASNDQARFYVFVDDELVGLVDRAKEVGTAAWIAPLGVPIGIEPPLLVLLLSLMAGLGVAAATRRWPVGIATTTSGVAMLLLCAGTTRPPPRYTWVHTDPLGTPLAVTNTPETGPAVAIWRARYEPFGKATVDEDPDGNTGAFSLNVRFPGQYEDAETGWYFNFQRDYDSATGRYLSADPIGLNERVARAFDASVDRRLASLEFTPYAYANSNPTLFTDPTGQYGLGGFLGGAAFNFAFQFGTNYFFGGRDAGKAFRCIDVNDVLISAAVGAVAPTLLANVVLRKPGPFGHTAMKNFVLFATASLPGGAALKHLAPERPIGGNACECEGLELPQKASDFLHGF